MYQQSFPRPIGVEIVIKAKSTDSFESVLVFVLHLRYYGHL